MMQVGYSYRCVNGKFIEVIRTLGEDRVLAIRRSDLEGPDFQTHHDRTAMVFNRMNGQAMARKWLEYDVDPVALKTTTQEKSMCFEEHTHTKATLPPAEALAKLFKDDLGVEINPQALRMFIRARWDRIAPLAHAIHDGR